MQSISGVLKTSRTASDFGSGYFAYLTDLMKAVDLDMIGAFCDQMLIARKEGATIFIIGNGGSAATASHMANDFGSDIRKKTNTEIPFRALSLTDNQPVMMAIANDDGYENIFLNQLRIHYRKGDKLIAISASGNSPNVVRAAEWMKEKGGTVMSLVGFDGGKIKAISDVCLHVKTQKGEYGPVEDLHMILDHLITVWLQHKVETEG